MYVFSANKKIKYVNTFYSIFFTGCMPRLLGKINKYAERSSRNLTLDKQGQKKSTQMN